MVNAPAALDRLTRLDVIARVGMVARGLVYLLVGLLVLQAGQHASEGQSGAFAALYAVPGGAGLLTATAIGLFAYAVFRLTAAVLDFDRVGNSLVAVLDRIGHAGVAVTYFVFGWSAGEVALGFNRIDPSYGNRSSRFLAETLLEWPLGTVILGLVGLGFWVSTVLNVKNAILGGHMRFTRPNSPAYVKLVGRLGMFTQAAIAFLIGLSILRAAWFENARQAHALGGALRHIHSQTVAYDAIAIGLMLFGAFSLMLARYRIVPKLDLVDAAREGIDAAREKVEEAREKSRDVSDNLAEKLA